MRTLFLQAPSFDGFDGGAGSRYQARREVRSFWYPTWLAQPAALVEGSKLIDAPSHRITLSQVTETARDYDLVVLHTSAPSFSSDVATIKALKAVKPGLQIGLVGAKVAVDPEGSLRASPLIDFVARNEFDFTIKEVADGRPLSEITGLSYRNPADVIIHNEERAILENMDLLPFVTPVYKRDLDINKYFNGYLHHPYMSLYTGRGCKSRCTFCLWPHTVGGHRYRKRSVGHVVEEIAWARKAFPEVKEFYFDDDTFTDDGPRAEAIAKELYKLGVTWSCTAKPNVPRNTLKVLRDNGLRLLLVGYEIRQPANPPQHQKGDTGRCRPAIHQGLPRVRDPAPRHLHHGAAGRDQGDDPRDDPLRHRNQSAYHSGLAGGALSGNVPVRPSGEERLARQIERGPRERRRRADRASALPPLEPHRDFQLGRGVLSKILFSLREDCINRGRDDPKPADDETPTARGR